MSPHRKDFKRRRKSKFKQGLDAGNNSGSSKQLLMVPLFLNNPSSSRSGKERHSKLVQGGLKAPSNILPPHSPALPISSTLPSHKAMSTEENGRGRTLTGREEIEKMVALAGFTSSSQSWNPRTPSPDCEYRERQSPAANFSSDAQPPNNGGGDRLLAERNEYYSKYCRNKSVCKDVVHDMVQHHHPCHWKRTSSDSDHLREMKCECRVQCQGGMSVPCEIEKEKQCLCGPCSSPDSVTFSSSNNSSDSYYRCGCSPYCGSDYSSISSNSQVVGVISDNLSETLTTFVSADDTNSIPTTLSASSSSSSKSSSVSSSSSAAAGTTGLGKSSSSNFPTNLSSHHVRVSPGSLSGFQPKLLPTLFSSFQNSKLARVLLSWVGFLVIQLWMWITIRITNITLIQLSPSPSIYFRKGLRELSNFGKLVKCVTASRSPTSAPSRGRRKFENWSEVNAYWNSGQRGGGLRSCQIIKGKSDFICIIAFGLCLLSPTVTPVITSNAIFPIDPDTASQGDRDMSISGGELSIPVEGVVGKRVEMPCDITPGRRDDTVYMVLWFRGEETIPFYSLDVRGKHVGGGKPWSAERPFGKRAYFQSTSEPARLIVEGGKISDQGIYRCRVDFRNSPSREARINLTITVPPNDPQIYDSTGMSIRGEVGPFIEGSNIELTCIVREGAPSPMVQWYLNDELVDSSYHVKNDKEVINHISVPNIQRSHHRASLSCRASNTLLVPPVTKTVYFELNLRPLSVSIPIKHRNPQLTAETQYEIKCETWGSHPAPVMSWWLDGREEKGSAVEESRGSNNSVSRLFFTPNASVDGQVLTCRAENPHVTAGAMEDSWRLRVVYSPMLRLRMGSSLNPRDIKEGDDVYFECHIRANPQVHKLAWYHNGLLLHHNRSAGVILSNQSLVLQKVSRPSAGNYSCRASNVQGEGTSNHVLLDIMYAPACQTELSGTDAPIIIAASRSEDVNITCEMDALPDKLKFQWTHTNTVGENSELDAHMFTTVGSKSLLLYHLRSEEDFGTLLCWAHNSIGSAERPCVYQLVPADVPQPVENCSIINRTSTSVEITCEPGFDGGLPQSFLLEAYQTGPTERRGLLSNITLDRPTFALSRLDADGTFHFKIYSVNRKGRSSASTMDGIVLRYPAMQSAKVRDLEKTTIAIIIGCGSAIVLGVVSLIAFCIHRIRHPISGVELEKSYSREFGTTRRGSGNDELYRNDSKKGAQPKSPFTAQGEFDEDGDPDLIPTSKNVKAAAMGSVYSRLSNGEINQRYVAGPPDPTQEKIPLRPMDPDLSVSMPCAMAPTGDPYSQGLPNYATFRGKPNGLGLKQQQRQQPPPRPQMVSSSSTSFHHGKTIVVNIDTRLIGQQLASNQLPESCV